MLVTAKKVIVRFLQASGGAEDVVQKEIKAAKSIKELNEVLRKYNVKTAG